MYAIATVPVCARSPSVCARSSSVCAQQAEQARLRVVSQAAGRLRGRWVFPRLSPHSTPLDRAVSRSVMQGLGRNSPLSAQRTSPPPERSAERRSFASPPLAPPAPPARSGGLGEPIHGALICSSTKPQSSVSSEARSQAGPTVVCVVRTKKKKTSGNSNPSRRKIVLPEP